MLTAGIVGMPNVGKSTLFNAVTNSQVEAANYPFATISPHKGTVEVDDERVNVLSTMFKSAKTIAATFQFIDIAGLVKGASKGEGLGNQFLANIRECDAIIHIVRCFEDPEIVHVEGSVDPKRDAETINLELILADQDVVRKRIGKIEKKATVTKDKEAKKELETLKKIDAVLDRLLPARAADLSDDEKLLAKSFNLLTAKPTIYVANVGEDDMADASRNPHFQTLKKIADEEGAVIVPICARMEEEIAALDKADRREFLESLGVKESGLSKVVNAAYKILGLETFFTTGPDETRAWTFKTGSLAPKCAGIIHTDFERGFIKAEVYSYADLMKYKTAQGVKENGRYRIEGKDYVMRDGDIVFFKFNV